MSRDARRQSADACGRGRARRAHSPIGFSGGFSFPLLQSVRVDQGGGIVADIVVEIGPVGLTQRIGGQPSAPARLIVAAAEIRQAGLGVVLLARKAEIGPARRTAGIERDADAAVGIVVAIAEQRALAVECDRDRAEPVGEQMAFARRGSCFAADDQQILAVLAHHHMECALVRLA